MTRKPSRKMMVDSKVLSLKLPITAIGEIERRAQENFEPASAYVRRLILKHLKETSQEQDDYPN